MNSTAIKPKQTVKKLLSVLPERARDIIVSRYGLGKNPSRMTLDSIGKIYGITRERVRQIENYALGLIRKSDAYVSEKAIFDELESVVHSLGGIVLEEDLLNHFSKDKVLQNYFNFLLVLGHSFKKRKEDDEFKDRWHVSDELAGKVEESLRKLYKNLKDDDLLPESEMVSSFLNHVEELSEKYKNQEILKRWLSISKHVGKNALGDWGIAHSSNIKTKGMRDYAFLVIKKHGSPIHFREVAKLISQVFKKKAHIATCHNELIKDSRFVLVGRGLYALSEWGYAPGVVRDVVKKVLEKNGPLSKNEIIEKVLKERYVKENTILVNLQNQKYFRKDKDNKYHLLENEQVKA